MPEKFNPDQIIQESESESKSLREDAQTVAEWFIENQESLFKRNEVIEDIASLLDSQESWANKCIGELVGDLADPVQQVVKDQSKYVGVIQYKEFSDVGSYGYVHLDDLEGKKNRIICARCVEKYNDDSNVTHATEGQGTVDNFVSWEVLQNKMVAHYHDAHIVSPKDIEVGASLLSGTTIAGNISFHAGNDGSGSGLDADTVDGTEGSDLGGGLSEERAYYVNQTSY